jgi:hypothetical protein
MTKLRFRGLSWWCIVWMLAFAANPVRSSQPIPQLIAPSLQPMQVERDWWIAAPGGRYGLLELTTHSVWSEPTAKIRRTTLLLGPWHWTFDLSAPQFLTVGIIVTVTVLFAGGWIRTQRYGR